ncbi:MAG: DNA-protecting protein DprA [Mailhella sp.]|nr:DNA-protecting protein DprA [Mailhella sp.]
MKDMKLSEDTKAVLLLCCPLGRKPDKEALKTLGPMEYSRFAAALYQYDNAKTPADIFAFSQDDLGIVAGMAKIDAERIKRLLDRWGNFAGALESWLRAGLWAVSRGDAHYPGRFRDHLKDQRPPFLFGAGDPVLLMRGGLGMVGSRDVDETGAEFARRMANICAENLMPVVSGCARGVDTLSMLAAVDHGGTAVGFAADSLLKKSVSREYRRAIAEGKVLLLSAYNPEAGFFTGNAMGRNKHIYAQADYALVVSSGLEEGGTWAGAVEELKRQNHRPVFVRPGEDVPEGNKKLLKMGGIAWPDMSAGGDLRKILDKSVAENLGKQCLPRNDVFEAAGMERGVKKTETASCRPSLIGFVQPDKRAECERTEADSLGNGIPLAGHPAHYTEHPLEPHADKGPAAGGMPDSAASDGKDGKYHGRNEVPAEKQLSSRTADDRRASGEERISASDELFRAVLPVILEHLQETPLTAKELSADFEMAESQIRKWMDKAVAENRVRKLKKPVRFERIA